jgi:hypothetical protein
MKTRPMIKMKIPRRGGLELRKDGRETNRKSNYGEEEERGKGKEERGKRK